MSLPERATFDDAVQAYYGELLEERNGDGAVTPADLDFGCRSAYEFCTGVPDTEDQARYRWPHPFGRLWVSGLLDTKSYLDWALEKESALAHEQVMQELQRRRLGRRVIDGEVVR